MGSIVGVSFDSVEENCAFAEKFNFNYALLSDTTREMSVAYGAAKDVYAKYPERITYIVEGGRIVYAKKVSDIEAHVEEAIAELAKGS